MKTFNRLFLFLFVVFGISNCAKNELLHIEGEFIEAFIEGEQKQFSSVAGSYSNIDPSLGSIVLTRFDDDGSESLSIYINSNNLSRDSVPFSLPNQGNANTSLVWTNFKGSNGERSYYSHNIQISIDSWDADNYISGEFEGQITNNDGKELSVNEGKFRIQILE